MAPKNNKAPVQAVGENTAERAQKYDRKQVAERNRADPKTRTGKAPGKPAHGQTLDPQADQGNYVPGHVDCVVAIRKSASNGGQVFGLVGDGRKTL